MNHKIKRFDGINVIPFIDVLLVLLAIVLTTATFVKQSRLDLTLPNAQSKQIAPQQPPVELSINRNGLVYYNETIVDLSSLDIRLAKLKNSTKISLRVDRDVAFGVAVEVIDLLYKHSLHHLSIITEQKP